MRIKTFLFQNRRDFEAIFECERCGATETKFGYDDDNFHRNVIPQMICPKCGEVAREDYRPMGTKYVEGVVV